MKNDFELVMEYIDRRIDDYDHIIADTKNQTMGEKHSEGDFRMIKICEHKQEVLKEVRAAFEGRLECQPPERCGFCGRKVY